jgi:hypothetical protein
MRHPVKKPRAHTQTPHTRPGAALASTRLHTPVGPAGAPERSLGRVGAQVKLLPVPRELSGPLLKRVRDLPPQRRQQRADVRAQKRVDAAGERTDAALGRDLSVLRVVVKPGSLGPAGARGRARIACARERNR